MRLSNQLIREVVIEIAGEDAVSVIMNLKKRKNVSEFKIAAELDWDINYTRNILYKLYDANLVSFAKKKDVTKGWYVYFWTFKSSNIKHLVIKQRTKRLQNLKKWLSREADSNFYNCESGCVRFDFEKAMDFDFKCPECGRLLNHEDNSSKILEIRDKIATLESSIK